MHFDNPQALNFLLCLIPLALAAAFRSRKLRAIQRLLPRHRALRLSLRYALSCGFFLVFLGCLIIAMAGPVWGSRLVPETRQGTEVVLAFDVSRSMGVRDLSDETGASVSRLERAAALGRELAALPLGRFGAALGKGAGVMAVPLTEDREAVLAFIAGLSGDYVSGRGTNLESLVDAAAGAFLDAFPAKRLIVLFSDGEALSGSLAAAAKRALERNIAVCAVGLGSAAGGLVPAEEGEAGPLSFLQPESLQRTAEQTGGFYLDGGNGEEAVTRLLELSADSSAGTYRREPKTWRHLFALAALAALGISAAASLQPGGLGGSRPPIIFLLLLLSSCSQIQAKLYIIEGSFHSGQARYPEAITAYLKARAFEEAFPYAEYGLGCVYLAMDEKEAALERFAAAAEALAGLKPEEHTELSYRIRYNSGVVHFQNGDYEAAAGAFREALEEDGGKVEAKRNLELSLLSQEAGEQRTSEAPQVGAGTAGGDHEALFDYLRRKERDRWKSQEWDASTEFQGPDY